MTPAEAIAAEQARRDAHLARIREAVAAAYAVGGDTTFIVRRLEVYRTIMDALEVRTMAPRWYTFLRRVVAGMGAVPIKVGNVALFAACRPHNIPVSQARMESLALRRAILRKSSKVRASGAVASNVLAALALEGMPEELPPIRRGNARGDSGVRYAIAQESDSRAADLVAAVEQELRILRLRQQGLSLRAIGVQVGLDKMAVDKVLKRAMARLDSADEGEE